MKIIVRYECEICQREYDKETKAIQCEMRGIPDLLPTGLILGGGSGMYKNITFAVAEAYYNTGPSGKHLADFCAWACRDTGAGDSLGKERCSGNHLYDNESKFSGLEAPDVNHPTFKRMVKYLKSQNIEPTIFNGKEIVPLNNYLKDRKVA